MIIPFKINKGDLMVYIPSIGGLILLLLVLYLVLSAPVGSTRSLILTLINVLLLALVIYVILSWFGIIVMI